MQYDFNRPIDRWDNYAVKYDEMEQKYGRRDLLPMWIADMDLPTAQPVLDAIDARNRQAIFGYTSRPDSYFEAVCQWQEKRNGWRPDPKKCVFSLGVVPTLCTCVREFSQPGDEILFLTPVYGEFFDSVENWDRKPLAVSLIEQSPSPKRTIHTPWTLTPSRRPLSAARPFSSSATPTTPWARPGPRRSCAGWGSFA